MRVLYDSSLLPGSDTRQAQARIGYFYTPPGRDLYCSPCRLYEPTYRSSPHIPLEEVMWKAEEEVYSDNLLRRRRLSE